MIPGRRRMLAFLRLTGMAGMAGMAGLLGFIALTGLVAGCAQPDTVVLVIAQPSATQPVTAIIWQLRAEITVGDEARALIVPEDPEPITLPASFSLRIPRVITGPLRIVLTALDKQGNQVGRGTALFEDFDVGAQNEAKVTVRESVASTTAGM